MSVENGKSRYWCCTYFPPVSDFLDASALSFPTQVRYAVWQVESCPDTDKKHLQMYLEFNGPVSLSYLRSWLPGIHCERRRGTQQQAIDYCKKSESRSMGPWEFGTPALGQGTRSDLHAAVGTLKSGGLLAVATEHPCTFVKYATGFSKLSQITDTRVRSWMTELYIYYGPSGTGKSHRALTEATANGGGVFYLQRPASGSTVWWDGYHSQENIIIDEFYGWMNFTDFLRLCDKYPMQVQIKGGSVSFVGRRVYVTSNVCWYDWYKKHFEAMPLHREALMRRITNCELMSKPYVADIDFSAPETDDLSLLCFDDPSFLETDTTSDLRRY